MTSSLLDRPIAFHPALARKFGSINAAIYWQQLYFWRDKGKRSDGFIFKTKETIEKETTLSPYQQDKVRKELEKAGYLKTKLIRADGAPTLHYRITDGMVRNLIMECKETQHSECKETKESITESTQRTHIGEQSSQEEYVIVPDVEEKPQKKKKDYHQVFSIFAEVKGKPVPRNWLLNKTQQRAAENLFIERGPEKIRKALEFHRETDGEVDFLPDIDTPYDLDTKWAKLVKAKKRHYGD